MIKKNHFLKASDNQTTFPTRQSFRNFFSTEQPHTQINILTLVQYLVSKKSGNDVKQNSKGDGREKVFKLLKSPKKMP